MKFFEGYIGNYAIELIDSSIFTVGKILEISKLPPLNFDFFLLSVIAKFNKGENGLEPLNYWLFSFSALAKIGQKLLT